MPATAKSIRDSATMPAMVPSGGTLESITPGGPCGVPRAREASAPLPRKLPKSVTLEVVERVSDRGASLDQRLQVKQMARLALQNLSRAQVADEMSQLLGYSFSESRLESLVKESREQMNLSLGEAAAFCVATGNSAVFVPVLKALGLEAVEQKTAHAGRLMVSLSRLLPQLGELT